MITAALEKNALQTAIAIGACVPISAGLMGILQGPQMVGDVTAFLNIGSHFAYLSGLLFAIGLAFWSCIPGIETKTARCRLLTFIVLIGGLARGYDAILNGLPHGPMLYALSMELVVTPLLCLWQARVARRFA